MFARNFAALAGSAMLLATPALAQMEAQSQTVSVGDLDLSSESGQARLQRRIGQAASSVCGQTSRDLSFKNAFDTCRKAAIEGSRRQVAALGTGGTGIQVASRDVR
jgi:UrcA family protein